MRTLIAIAALVACSGVWADVTLPNNLQENSVASATDVMDNFSVLADAVNSQDDRLSSLESQIVPANTKLAFLGYIDSGGDRACKTEFNNDSAHKARTDQWVELNRLTLVPETTEYISLWAPPNTFALGLPDQTTAYQIHTGLFITTNTYDQLGAGLTIYKSPSGGYITTPPPSYQTPCVGYVPR